MMGSSVGYTCSSDFPHRSRARIAAVKIEVGLELEDSKRQLRWVSDLDAEVRKYILRVFIVFALWCGSRRSIFSATASAPFRGTATPKDARKPNANNR